MRVAPASRRVSREPPLSLSKASRGSQSSQAFSETMTSQATPVAPAIPLPGIPSAPPQPFYPTFEIKSARQPLFWAAAAHASGIIAGIYLWRPILWWVVAAAALAIAAQYFAHRRAWLGWTLALSAFFILGALNVQVR